MALIREGIKLPDIPLSPMQVVQFQFECKFSYFFQRYNSLCTRRCGRSKHIHPSVYYEIPDQKKDKLRKTRISFIEDAYFEKSNDTAQGRSSFLNRSQSETGFFYFPPHIDESGHAAAGTGSQALQASPTREPSQSHLAKGKSFLLSHSELKAYIDAGKKQKESRYARLKEMMQTVNNKACGMQNCVTYLRFRFLRVHNSWQQRSIHN